VTAVNLITFRDPKLWINLPESCAPVIEPSALASKTNPKPEFVKLFVSLISGIRATQDIDTIPSKANEAQRAFLDFKATPCKL
jgi:hypothetical protein